MRARFLLGWALFLGNVVVAATSRGDEGALKQRSSVTPAIVPVPVVRGDASAAGITAENVNVAGAVYFAAQLEELKVFSVVDKLVSLFAQGLLPLGGGKSDAGASSAVAERRLAEYRRGASQHLDATARKALYAQLLDANAGPPSRELDDLVARYAESTEGALPGGRARAGRALSAYLTRRGYGAPFEAATRLAQQVAEIERLLEDAAIKDAFNARDMWGVVDAVATQYLGGASNEVRHRSLATNGRKLLESLATPDGDSEALRRSAGEWKRASANLATKRLIAPEARVIRDGGVP